MLLPRHETNHPGEVQPNMVPIAFRSNLQLTSRYKHVGLLFPAIRSIFHILLESNNGGERSRADHVDEERVAGENHRMSVEYAVRPGGGGCERFLLAGAVLHAEDARLVSHRFDAEFVQRSRQRRCITSLTSLMFAGFGERIGAKHHSRSHNEY